MRIRDVSLHLTTLLLLACFFLILIPQAQAIIVDFEDFGGYDGMIIYQYYTSSKNITFDNYTDGSTGITACTSCNPVPIGTWGSTNIDYSNTQLTFTNNINYFSTYFAVPIPSEGTTLTVDAYSSIGTLISSVSNTNALNTFQKIEINGDNIRIIWLNHTDLPNRIEYDNISFTEFTTIITTASCYNMDFSGLSTWDVVGHIRVILYWLYNAPNCYLSPIWDFFANIINTIYSSMLWVINAGYNISIFIISIGTLITSIIGLISNTLYDVFSTNVYSAITFSIILMGISIVFFIRIYNIIADVSIFGWKLPKL